MTAEPSKQLKNLFRDRLFWLALLAGPLVWSALELWQPGNPSTETGLAQWWRLLVLAGLYPLLEEWLFRGLLQPQLQEYPPLRKTCCGLSHANLLTSLLFSAAHFLLQTPLWASLVFIPSLVFGFFRDRYNSVIPAIVLHTFYNLGFFLLR